MAEEFGKRIYREAWKRGWSTALKNAAVGDGAEWIWNLAGQYFPGAVQMNREFPAPEPVAQLQRQLDQFRGTVFIR